ncbi:MAG: hypothetical protein PHH98_00145 [Candidatus Gracilibacteria bacterium]|nr:hypothetical protein [Candidatus Gracilibacteria bacterium]
MIGRGFMYDVTENNGEIIKIPRAPGNTSINKEQLSLSIHKSYLGKYIPDTNIVSSNNSVFLTSQEFVNGGTPIDLYIEGVKDDVKDLLDLGQNMQNEQGILFDVFGM